MHHCITHWVTLIFMLQCITCIVIGTMQILQIATLFPACILVDNCQPFVDLILIKELAFMHIILYTIGWKQAYLCTLKPVTKLLYLFCTGCFSGGWGARIGMPITHAASFHNPLGHCVVVPPAVDTGEVREPAEEPHPEIGS